MTATLTLPDLAWLDDIPEGMEKPVWYDWIKTCPPTFATKRTWSRPTLGYLVSEIAGELGWKLMPWQQFVADVSLEYEIITVPGHLDGEPEDVIRFFYRTEVVTVPRQSGKTSYGLSKKVMRMVRFPDFGDHPAWAGPQNVLYMAQTGKKTEEKFRLEQAPRIKRSKTIRPLYDKVRLANGSMGIAWKNGSNYSIEAPTEEAGHSSTLSYYFIDEAWAYKDFRVDSGVDPTTITIHNAQATLVSTQGTDESVYFNSYCEAGETAVRDGDTTGICYFNWSAPAGSSLHDPEVWPKFHPAVGFTQTVETLMSVVAKTLALPEGGEDEAKRAFFNWRQKGKTFQSKLPAAMWAATADPSAGERTVGKITVAVDVTPDRKRSYIGWAGWLPDGDVYAELDYVDLGDPLEVPDRLLKIVENPDNEILVTAVNPTGPAGSLVNIFERMGIEVRAFNGREFASACALVYDLVLAEKLHHGDQPELNAAATSAGERKIGEAWGWAASTTADAAPIAPLNCITVAIGALVTPPEEDKSEKPSPVAGIVDMPA